MRGRYGRRGFEGRARARLLRRRSCLFLALAVVAAGFLLSTALATASEVEPPTIASTEVTEVTEASVTLVGQINPNDTEGEYEFRLVQQGSPPAFRGEPIPGGQQVHHGRIGTGEQIVSAVITGLQPGHLYWYALIVTNSEQRARTDAYFSFHYSGGFPEGIGSVPYEPEIPEWTIDASEAFSAQVLSEYEAKQRQAAKEHEERLAAEQAALKHQEEALVPAKPVPVEPVCIVPSLMGHTLTAALRAIHKAHCRLGRVHRPSHRHRGTPIVISQTPKHGKKLVGASVIDVALGFHQSTHHPRAY